jgi:hypothetical protein
MTINLSSLTAFLRNLGSLAAIVIGAANVGGLPAGVRATLVAIGGILQGVEHYVSNPSTGPTPAPLPVVPPTP